MRPQLRLTDQHSLHVQTSTKLKSAHTDDFQIYRSVIQLRSSLCIGEDSSIKLIQILQMEQSINSRLRLRLRCTQQSLDKVATDVVSDAFRVCDLGLFICRFGQFRRLKRSRSIFRVQLTPSFIRLRMRPNIRHPAFTKGAKNRSNIAVVRVPPQHFRRRLGRKAESSAVLEVQPATGLGLPALVARRESPVGLDGGVFFVVDLRALLIDLSHYFIAFRDQAEARIVACEESA
jgi:hypothetical protein